MKTRYFDKSSEMTAFAESKRGIYFRVRTECKCHCKDNRRNSILVVWHSFVIYKLIRCKACRKEAENGNL